MTNTQELYAEGCVKIVGAVIKQAIQDACTRNNDSKEQDWKRSAETFLFYPGKLEEFLKRYGLEGHANCGYIRRQAKDVISGRMEINDVSVDKTEEII